MPFSLHLPARGDAGRGDVGQRDVGHGDAARRALKQVRVGLLHPRLLLALKSAAAVGIAWWVAPQLPGVADDYPYYGPLGALISMHPTLMSSIRNGVQTLAGLAIGVLLAAAVIVFAEPNLVTISVIVGIGVLIAGARWLGAGAETVPTAVLFVLIVGGPNADAYSIGYLTQMTAGIVIGLAVNLLVFPPLTVATAATQLAGFRDSLATQLNEMAMALRESWPPEHEDWASRGTQLATMADGVRAALHSAADSRKVNPRSRLRRHQRDLTRDYNDLAAFETITFHVRDMTEVVAGAVWGTALPLDLDPRVQQAISDAFAAVADTLTSWDTASTSPSLENAQRTLDRVTAHAADTKNAVRGMNPAAVIALDLHRILVVIEARQQAVASGPGSPEAA